MCQSINFTERTGKQISLNYDSKTRTVFIKEVTSHYYFMLHDGRFIFEHNKKERNIIINRTDQATLYNTIIIYLNNNSDFNKIIYLLSKWQYHSYTNRIYK